VYVTLGGFVHSALGRSSLELTAALLLIPPSVVFMLWTGSVLTAKRLAYRDLLPFAIIASAATAGYSVGSRVYLPHLFSTYATRYGVIGAVFAMISSLFAIMLILVVSAAAGREVNDELDRIRRGERPADDEVRQQWHEVTEQARSRFDTLRQQIRERRNRRNTT